jgi:peptide/nickel transport system substrate-binding protein
MRRSAKQQIGWAAVSLVLAAAAWAQSEADFLRSTAETGRYGGRLVVALRAEPTTLNPAATLDHPSRTVLDRLMADLIHVDRRTQATVPALAKSWSVSENGRTYTLELRHGIRFSDGHPFDADDVVFTFQVLLDESVAAPHRALLTVGGEPIAVHKLGSHTVRFELAEPYAVGERLFDSIAILPRHRLEAAYREGRLDEAWSLGTDPAEIVGLGPFRLERYLPGQLLELGRNPHYWKVDAEGQRLPYLDRLVFVFVATEDAQVIRFEAGESQLIDHLSAGNYALLEREQERHEYLVEDLGASLDYSFLFFNLNDLAGRGLDEIERKQQWFRQLAFRQAVSAAVDRDAIVRIVYGGRATPIATLVTPGNKRWMHPDLRPTEHSPETAKRLLQAAGFVWDEAGSLRDAGGREVGFTIMTGSSSPERMGIATLIQQDLRQIGIDARVAGLEFRTLVGRVFDSFEYEACVLAFGGGDADPNASLTLLSSDGSQHFWRLSAAAPPAWETEIDTLMRRQLTAVDPAVRQDLYDRVQELVAANQPMIFLVSPNVLVGAARGLGNFRPAILDHFTLWNADELFWRSAGR